MARAKVKLNSPGIAALLKSREMEKLVTDVAEEIAETVRRSGSFVDENGDQLPVEVGLFITDRARASVLLAHPAGASAQAKDGVLTRAASANGHSVSGS